MYLPLEHQKMTVENVEEGGKESWSKDKIEYMTLFWDEIMVKT